MTSIFNFTKILRRGLGKPQANTLRVGNVEGALTVMDGNGNTYPLQLGNAAIRTSINNTAKTATYTMALTDGTIIGNTTAGGFTVNLLALANVPDGHRVTVINIGSSNTLTVDGSGSETINGATTHTLATQYAKATYQKYSAGWLIVA